MLSQIARLVFFHGAHATIVKSRSKDLTPDDMPQLPEDLAVAQTAEIFSRLRTDKISLFLWDLIRLPKAMTIRLIIFCVLWLVATSFLPLLMGRFISVLQDLGKGSDLFEVLAFGLGVIAVMLFQSLAIQHYFYYAVKSVVLTTSGLNKILYAKTLRLTSQARMKRPIGDSINFLGTDSGILAEFLWMVTELIQCLALLSVCFSLLIHYLGLGAIAALGALVLCSPVTFYLSKIFVSLDEILMKQRDERVSLTSQILSGIRVVKAFAWEKACLNDIDDKRSKEIATRKKLIYAESLSLLMYLTSNFMLSIIGFSTYWYLGGALKAEIVFPCLIIFSNMENPFGRLTDILAHLSSAKVSAKRFCDYMNEDEITKPFLPLDEPNLLVRFDHVDLAYEGSKAILEDINLSIRKGESIAIVGPVGAGKSTFMASLLGELHPSKGQIHMKEAKLAWSCQKPFICNLSLKDNITFGEEHLSWEEAAHLCALDLDVKQLQSGPETIIGELGVNLSGGQKQRLCLARIAAMTDADLILLDDPVSALDEGTETFIMEHLLKDHWKSKTLIMITHRLRYLERFDRVLFFQNGLIEADDSFENLLGRSQEFRRFYASSLATKTKNQNQLAPSQGHEQSSKDISSPDIMGAGAFITEDREVGSIKKGVFLDYFKAMIAAPSAFKEAITGLLLIASTCFVVLLPLSQNAWLSLWMNQKSGASSSQLLGSEAFNISVFAAIGVIFLAIFFLHHLLWAFRSLHAAQFLLEKAQKSVLYSRIRFFDTNPIGRVLNRFSNDHEMVEKRLPWSFDQTIRALLQGSIHGVTLGVLFPLLVIPFIPVMVIFYFMQKDFRRAGREGKRFASVARSPRFAHFKQTLEGLEVIRALQKQKIFSKNFDQTVDMWSRMYFGQSVLNRWFSSRLPLLGGVILSSVVACLIFMSSDNSLAAGSTGFALVCAMNLWNNMNWCIRSFSEAESHLIGVERLKTYGQLEPEGQEAATLTAPKNWPSSGHIIFDRVEAKHDKTLPSTIRDISFEVKNGEKVGIVGRTGSGKSTLIQTLFRFTDIASGQVKLDGIDILKVPIQYLRRQMAMIPQEATLFTGSIRQNLDRFNEFSDQSVWWSLEQVFLRDKITIMGGLQTQVEENGANFSAGQRQLLCLARALLMDVKVIVIDEATANVDPVTDQMIHKVLSKECRNRSVLVIAHRLGTLADCHKIVELSGGRIKKISTSSAEENILNAV